MRQKNNNRSSSKEIQLTKSSKSNHYQSFDIQMIIVYQLYSADLTVLILFDTDLCFCGRAHCCFALLPRSSLRPRMIPMQPWSNTSCKRILEQSRKRVATVPIVDPTVINTHCTSVCLDIKIQLSVEAVYESIHACRGNALS